MLQSPTSRVYHFDTDMNNQNQATDLEINYTGEAPELLDKSQTNGQIYFNPAVLETVPHEMKGKSLYGHFSVKTNTQTATVNATAEMWIRLFDSTPAVVLVFGNEHEKITFKVGIKGALGLAYGAAEADNIAHGKAFEDSFPYSAPDKDGNIVVHEAVNDVHEIISLDDMAIAVGRKTWMHIAAVSTPNKLSFFIGAAKIEFDKTISAAYPLSVSINPKMLEFNLDELMFDKSAAGDFAIFAGNTLARIPWAALDYTKKHFVLEAQDPELMRTNIFESELFKKAVYEAIDTRT